MKSINSLKLVFFAALGLLGAAIYSTSKSIFLVLGSVAVCGVFFRVLLEILKKMEDK